MRKALRIAGIGVTALLAIAVVAGSGLAVNGRSRINGTYTTTHTLVSTGGDVARGQHVMQIHGCADCHGASLEGRVFLDMPLGTFVAPNLTPGKGGVGARYKTVADWDRAVRHGVRPDGRWIAPFMPYTLYHNISDDEAAALGAYLASLAPIDNETPATTVKPLGYVAMGAPGSGPDTYFAMLSETHATAPAPAATAEYGKYRASSSCVECHGAQLEGGKHPAPDAPPGPALHHTAGWTLQQFTALLREGKRPDGSTVSEWMPSVKAFRHLDDTEIAALHAYIRSLPAPTVTASR